MKFCDRCGSYMKETKNGDIGWLNIAMMESCVLLQLFAEHYLVP